MVGIVEYLKFIEYAYALSADTAKDASKRKGCRVRFQRTPFRGDKIR